MTYIAFNKQQLINLEFALSRELLRSNRSGAYSATTIAGCNTRKYHGLLVVPQPQLDHHNHLLLSAIDETVIQHDEAFNFGLRMYPNGIHDPKGHKYLREFVGEPIPQVIYRVGGVILSKEMLFAHNEARLLIRYTLLEAHSPTTLRLKPFLAFRNIHQLTRANLDANTSAQICTNGVSWQMYHGYSRLYMQLSAENEYVHVPDWYYNVEYVKDAELGLPHNEDLFSPGFFELPIRKGESIIVSAGLEPMAPSDMKRRFTTELRKRTPRDSFENCLINAAEQFVVKTEGKTSILAGFPWFGSWGRDTFIAAPGLLLTRNDQKTFTEVIDSMVERMRGPFFPNINRNNQPEYESADTPLWFFWALQQYVQHTGQTKPVWKKYGPVMKTILEAYRNGADYQVFMNDKGLISAGSPAMALTWMDVYVKGKPVTPRPGYTVEINALWYNAIRFAIELANASGDHQFVADWQGLADNIPQAFAEMFWDSGRAYLADHIWESQTDWTVRPNMVIAVSLPYTPVTDEIKNSVLRKAKNELLTPRGLRTLSPEHPRYKGMLTGSPEERDEAYHNGTVFPWLSLFFAEGWLSLNGRSGLRLVKELYHNFEPAMFEAGLGSISEVYDGDPPHEARGAISQAWSVAALIQIKQLIDQLKPQDSKL
ncbi:MAG: glycogen debranching enzyme family protein [Bacteroidetes bacterium]|nr:glycogen debranching enzyme family protein [Bacteroidota bacterium]